MFSRRILTIGRIQNYFWLMFFRTATWYFRLLNWVDTVSLQTSSSASFAAVTTRTNDYIHEDAANRGVGPWARWKGVFRKSASWTSATSGGRLGGQEAPRRHEGGKGGAPWSLSGKHTFGIGRDDWMSDGLTDLHNCTYYTSRRRQKCISRVVTPFTEA